MYAIIFWLISGTLFIWRCAVISNRIVSKIYIVAYNECLTRFKPSVNKTLRKNSFPIRCIDQWNNLDENIVLSESVLTFKTLLNQS
jgi:hypothetical protein